MNSHELVYGNKTSEVSCCQLGNEKTLVVQSILGIILPSYVGILIKAIIRIPIKPIIFMECHEFLLFFSWLNW